MTSINDVIEAIHRIRADLNTIEVFLWNIRKSIEKSFKENMEVKKEESEKKHVFEAGEDRPDFGSDD